MGYKLQTELEYTKKYCKKLDHIIDLIEYKSLQLDHFTQRRLDNQKYSEVVRLSNWNINLQKRKCKLIDKLTQIERRLKK